MLKMLKFMQIQLNKPILNPSIRVQKIKVVIFLEILYLSCKIFNYFVKKLYFIIKIQTMNIIKIKNASSFFQINLAFLLCIFILNPINLKAQSIDLEKIDKYILDAQNKWNIPGMAIAIVKNDKIIFSKGFGLREFGKEEKDWSSLYFGFYEGGKKRNKEREQKVENERNKNSKPALSLVSYSGKYRSDMYGDVEVKLENGKLVLHFVPSPIYIGDLEHWQYNTFSIKLRKVYSLPRGTVNFILDENAKVKQVEIDIPNPDFDFTELKLYRVDD